MPILPMPIKFDLVPIGDVETVQADRGLSAWTFTGNDPRFLLQLAKPLRPGLYKIEFTKPVFVPDRLHAKLYLDTGSDFSEQETIAFQFSREEPAVFFQLARDVRRLRFDPHDATGTISTAGLTLTRISTTLHRATRVTQAAAGRVASFDDAVRLLTKSYTILRKDGVIGLRHAVSRSVARQTLGLTGSGYAEWVRRYDSFSEQELAQMRNTARQLAETPLISVLMPVYNAPKELLIEAIESVKGQVYTNWQLCIADDASTNPDVRDVLNKYAAEDERIEVVFRPQNGHISEASNNALSIVRGDWFALLDHDDLLRPHALLEVALEIMAHPDTGLIYSDEDKIDGQDKRYDAFFKPDFSLELLRSQNYFNHLTVHRTDLVRSEGGWRKGFEGSQDYDLNLRIIEKLKPSQVRHIPKILYHWRAAEGSTASAGSAKSYAYTAGLRALKEHAERAGLNASAEAVEGLPFYRYRHKIPSPEPKVSLIIPTRDRLNLIKGCVDSILEKTSYQNFEILIVDNGSIEPETLTWFDSLAENQKVRVLPYDQPFNFSAMNNFAVAQADGVIVGLINNDIEVISPDWLSEMVSFANQSDIGCVGAKLLYPDNTLQHGGIVVGVGGVANHSHLKFGRSDPGYFGRMLVSHNCSAVTAACLVVRKSVFHEAGGLNERDLAVAFNDVDFCLRVQRLGYRNVLTPYAELYHLESVSRGQEDNPEKLARFQREVDFMVAEWKPEIKNDPYYSPNLTLVDHDYSIAFPPRVEKLPRISML